MLAVTPLAERPASGAPHRPPLSHTVGRSKGHGEGLMRSIIGGLLALGALAIAISAAFGCMGGVLDVAQPMVDWDHGITVCTVTYQRMCLPSTVIPGYEICFTGKPNCVCSEYLGRSVNINAANILGITATVDTFHMKTNGLLGDTLHAIIDLSDMKPMSDSLGDQLGVYSVDPVVRATVECVLLTAYNHRSGLTGPVHTPTGEVEAKYIWLEIRGSAEYDSLAGVFSFESLGRLPRQRHFF